MTSELYARFLSEEAIRAINAVVQNWDEVIFQDHQRSKHRTQVAMEVVYDLFEERIEPNDGDAKFANVWSIANTWGIMKEKTRAQKFEILGALVGFIIIQINRNQVYEH
jgi:hypothetical protein